MSMCLQEFDIPWYRADDPNPEQKDQPDAIESARPELSHRSEGLQVIPVYPESRNKCNVECLVYSAALSV